MNTLLLRGLPVLLAAAVSTTAARADDWTGPEEVAQAAYAFGEAAKHLHKSIGAVAGDSPLLKDARHLAESAEHFRGAVEKGTTRAHALKDFGEIGRDYDRFAAALKKDHDAHHDEHVIADAKAMAQAFDALRTHMEGRRPAAGGWTSPKEVAKAARGFADAAGHLHKSIQGVATDSPLVAEVHGLAKSAAHFHKAVEEGATYDHVLKDFRKIEQSYDHFEKALKKDHDAHHDEHVVADAKGVKAAFEHLLAHMEGRRDPPAGRLEPPARRRRP